PRNAVPRFVTPRRVNPHRSHRMPAEIFKRGPDIAEGYERMVVPAVFERYARDLVERARPIGPSDRILDLGCGTGIIARVLRERVGGAASIVGLDASAPMLAKARAIAPEIEWREGNAAALPFPNESFDLVLSQEMLQFVPDAVAALREVARVLTPGGRVLATTWRPRSEQPFHDALGHIAERHLGKSNDRRWSLDGAALRDAFIAAGFVDVKLQTVSLREQYKEFSPRLNAMVAGFDLAAFSDEERERRFAAIEADSREVFERFATDGGFGAPTIANLVTAKKGRNE